MEDTGRGLAADPITASQSKGSAPDCKEYTIMLIGSIGKIHSFKISRRFLFYTLAFLSLYIFLSIIVFYLYFRLYFEQDKKIAAFKDMETELHEKRRALDQNRLYTEGLEDYIKNLRRGSDGSVKKSNPSDADLKEGIAPADNEKIIEKGEVSPQKEAVVNTVDVRDIKFRIGKSGLTFEYKLTNNLAEHGPAEGYIHIIARDKNGEYPPDWNKDKDIQDGTPADYKKGQEFFIQRFKTYQRQYKMLPDYELPSLIRILAYDRSGKKILEKDIPVTDVSSND